MWTQQQTKKEKWQQEKWKKCRINATDDDDKIGFKSQDSRKKTTHKEWIFYHDDSISTPTTVTTTTTFDIAFSHNCSRQMLDLKWENNWAEKYAYYSNWISLDLLKKLYHLSMIKKSVLR